MRKIFLDIGAHNGQTLKKALEVYPDMDLYIGIEPIPSMVKKCKEIKDPRVVIHNIALDMLDVEEKKVEFFVDMSKGNHQCGSSLLKDKKMRKQSSIKINCIDVSAFFNRTFQEGDEVIMKIDVEGKEYDIFDSLISSGLLKKYVTKIHAEWHWHKVLSITKERHNEILIALNKLDYNLKGKSRADEFYKGF